MTTRYVVLTYSNGQRAYLDLPDTTAALGEAVADGPDNLIHGSGVLGGHVEVLAEAIDEAMSLDGITAVITSGNGVPIASTSVRSRRCRSVRFMQRSQSWRLRARERQLPHVSDGTADKPAQHRPLLDQQLPVQEADQIFALALGEDRSVQAHP